MPAVRRDPQQTKGESLLAVALFYFSRLGLVSVSYLSRLEKGRLAASPEATSRLLSSAERCLARSDEGGGLGKADDYMRGKLS